jgi:tRNA threonylcarbamoyladenosine biosynthesis protein TsaE
MRESVVLKSKDAAETAALGAQLGRSLANNGIGPPVVIYLHGELGAGKTTFVAGLLRELGVQGPVRSPTYTLIEPYALGAQVFYHLDLYRLQEPRELEPLGLRELLMDGAVLLVEWAERGGAQLPAADICIDFRYEDGESRRMLLTTSTKAGAQLALDLGSSTTHE